MEIENDLLLFVAKICRGTVCQQRYRTNYKLLLLFSFFRPRFRNRISLKTGISERGVKQTVIVLRLGRDIKSACK